MGIPKKDSLHHHINPNSCIYLPPINIAPNNANFSVFSTLLFHFPSTNSSLLNYSMAWTRGPTIGRGASAAVSLATTPAGDLFAVKSTDLASSALLRNEECLLSRLFSPYIIRCLGSDVTHDGHKPVYNLFLEYSAGGSLSDLIKKQGGSFDEKSIRFYAHQLLLGIEYLHLNGLVHCDIKAHNILIGSDGLKIADFGCAKWAESGGFGAGAFSGTPAYMAPEVARGEEQSFPADIWALGCTVIEMATGTHPWPEMKDPASALYRIAFSGDVPEFPSWFSGEAKDFLGKCLMRESEKRWTAAELLRHPFLASVEESCEEMRELRRSSPTSVTDQGFWDAVEMSECCENIATEMASSSDSPRHRMEALICNGDFAADEKEWVSVRSDEVEDLDQDLVEAEATIPSLINLVVVEDSWFDFCNEDSSTSTSPIAYNYSSKHLMYNSELSVYVNRIISSSTSNIFLTTNFHLYFLLLLLGCDRSFFTPFACLFLKE